MQIILNGEKVSFMGETVADLVSEFDYTPPFAVAVNLQFVSKSDYANKALSENDKVDVVSPVVGG